MLRKLIYRAKARRELIKAFRSAGLCRIYKSKGGSDRVSYPIIHDVHFDEKEKSLRYVFTLLNGMDPKEVAKKEYVFRQHFGRNVELRGDLKRYVLTIYSEAMTAELAYKAQEISEVVKSHGVGIICGKDRLGRYVAFDLRKQPHILIAGETGSGKSTQLRSILTTLICTKKPSELQLYLGDCKKSEFHIFRKVEHVQCVYSSARDISKMLRHIKKELDERSNLTELFEVSHVDDLPADHRRPYIIVCIDEFVMLRKNEEIMEILTEIVAIGRTLGVFGILSMQRPNAQVLDTTIRANLTVSMGFKLRDKIEARIVNTPKADEIETSGRFIMNSDKLYELQAPYLTLDEAKRLLNPYIISKGPVKEVTPEEVTPITEKDVFLDAVD